MSEEDYAVAMKEHDTELALEELANQPPVAQHVFMASADNGGIANAPENGAKAAAERDNAMPLWLLFPLGSSQWKSKVGVASLPRDKTLVHFRLQPRPRPTPSSLRLTRSCKEVSSQNQSRFSTSGILPHLMLSVRNC
jgi:hypothetical protein